MTPNTQENTTAHAPAASTFSVCSFCSFPAFLFRCCRADPWVGLGRGKPRSYIWDSQGRSPWLPKSQPCRDGVPQVGAGLRTYWVRSWVRSKTHSKLKELLGSFLDSFGFVCFVKSLIQKHPLAPSGLFRGFWGRSALPLSLFRSVPQGMDIDSCFTERP